MINCIQLYLPESLFIEYHQNYSEDDIRKLFNKDKIFHIKTYSYCSFVHFYSHHGKEKHQRFQCVIKEKNSTIHHRVNNMNHLFILFRSYTSIK
jgi:hypothetical protein